MIEDVVVNRDGDVVRAQVRLVNLTAHDVVLEATEVPQSGQPVDPPPTVRQRLEPVGSLALVVEPVRGRASVMTEVGIVRLVTLRRSEEVEGLPAPAAGVLYLVPRLTALAALGRDDLVFPHLDMRDERGVIQAAGALGGSTTGVTSGGGGWRRGGQGLRGSRRVGSDGGGRTSPS